MKRMKCILDVASRPVEPNCKRFVHVAVSLSVALLPDVYETSIAIELENTMIEVQCVCQDLAVINQRLMS